MIQSYSPLSSFLHSLIYRFHLEQYVMLFFEDSWLPSIWFLHHSRYPCVAWYPTAPVLEAASSSNLQSLWLWMHSTYTAALIPGLCSSFAFDYLRMQPTSSLCSFKYHLCFYLLEVGLYFEAHMQLTMSYGFSWWMCIMIFSPSPSKAKADSWRTPPGLLSVDAWHRSGHQLIFLGVHELMTMDADAQKEQQLYVDDTGSWTNYWLIYLLQIDCLSSK